MNGVIHLGSFSGISGTFGTVLYDVSATVFVYKTDGEVLRYLS
ncbi:MAG TPA: hypothetical protein PKI33_09610 [Anaerolineales bacterium]|nr:hypothetical protein [Anaerolineales bacterium]